MCSLNGGGVNKWGEPQCKIQRVKNMKANFCAAGQKDCERAQQFQKLDNQAHTQYVADVDHTQEDFNSIVFNAFIFLQVSPPCEDTRGICDSFRGNFLTFRRQF